MGDNPIFHAERLASWYASQAADADRRKHGIYFTPPLVAHKMGMLCRNGSGHFVRIADPAAGTGILAAAACVALAEGSSPPRHIDLVCYEIDNRLCELLESSLAHLCDWLLTRQIKLRYRVRCEDFILANSDLMSISNESAETGPAAFDAVICNPPYFKLPKSDLRARACASVVHGQPNIYGLFMAIGLSLLREGGRFVFITPRSFASGPYFQRLREVLFSQLRPTDIHVFDSRTDTFSDVLQETVITAGTRTRGWRRSIGSQRIRLSSSAGASDIRQSAVRTLPLMNVLDMHHDNLVLHLPASKSHDSLATLIRRWPGSLYEYGWKVSTGPVVAFRAREFLRNASSSSTIPLLWLQNVHSMSTRWPAATRKPQHLSAVSDSEHLVLPNKNYVLIRRFSAKEEKKRITAAPYIARDFQTSRIGFENHLNYVCKVRGQLSVDETYGLAALLNSQVLDAYFRISSGNTQVSATELRALRLPPLAAIRRIGERARIAASNIDTIVAEELSIDL